TSGMFILREALPPIPDIDKPPLDSCRHGHSRRYQMGAATLALATFEVAVAGRSAAFTRLEHVSIHCQTHRATRFAPLETSFFANLTQALFFGLLLHQT